jgi:hypothetical protein
MHMRGRNSDHVSQHTATIGQLANAEVVELGANPWHGELSKMYRVQRHVKSAIRKAMRVDAQIL